MKILIALACFSLSATVAWAAPSLSGAPQHLASAPYRLATPSLQSPAPDQERALPAGLLVAEDDGEKKKKKPKLDSGEDC